MERNVAEVIGMKASGNKRMPRILIVEDDFDIQQVLGVYLKHAGFDVLSASDGNEAMQLIPNFCPDLIVLDLMMQPVDGWAVLEWLHSGPSSLSSGLPSSSPVPVLVLTALNNLKEQVH
ncbi:MAG TPA: response regulator, partial [Ktedonobacteraceae bacterium]|nr:response regulator [Ktedonobacteraceae bacterium]